MVVAVQWGNATNNYTSSDKHTTDLDHEESLCIFLDTVAAAWLSF